MTRDKHHSMGPEHWMAVVAIACSFFSLGFHLRSLLTYLGAQ